MYPIIERKAVGRNVVSYHILNKGDKSVVRYSTPYFDELQEEIGKSGGPLDKVILVSDSEPVAIKCFRYLYEEAKGEEDDKEDDEYDFYILYDDDVLEEMAEEPDPDLTLVRFSKEESNKAMPVNVYSNILDSIKADTVIYEGIAGVGEDADDKDRLTAMLTDARKRKYIWISPEMLDDSWVTDLRMDQGFSLLRIGGVPRDYYDDIFQKLLKREGYALPKNVSSMEIVNRIVKLRGTRFTEEDLDWIIQLAIRRKKLSGDSDNMLHPEDFQLNEKVEDAPLEKLKALPGLADVKDMVTEQAALLKEARRNDKLKKIHGNMLFYGNPGTGKTTSARLLAEVMAEYGTTNATFIEASRADIIGKYVGFTAGKIAALFEKARNGVLFIDEAGFFLNQGAGGYVNEALKEFVRFMENCPDVTVIFAMYEKEVEAFLNLDAGLSSRISRMVRFKDYSIQELQEICMHIAKENGYKLEKEALMTAMDHIAVLKRGRNFGNARDVRKIVESSIIAHSVRLMKPGEKKPDCLTKEDVEKGIRRLKPASAIKANFGFQYQQNTNTAAL